MADPKDMMFFDSPSGATYTTRDGDNAKLTLDALLKLYKDLPKPPEVIVFNIKEFDNLPSNTAFISSDLADKIEEILKEQE